MLLAYDPCIVLQFLYGMSTDAYECYCVCHNHCNIHNNYYISLFSEAIKRLKSMGVPVPAGFKINVTDQALFDACKIPLPEMCKSQLQWSNRIYP